MVVFDSAVLTLLLSEQSRGPLDPATGQPIDRCRERMEFLVQSLSKSGETILIPAPVLSEVLTISGAAGLRYIAILQKTTVFRIEPFDTRAAIELAEINKMALGTGDKKSGIDAPWQKIKIDRQIVSIARVAGARTLYTNDGSLKATAESLGIDVIGIHQLPPPKEDAQSNLLDLLNKQAETMNKAKDTDSENE